MRDRTVVGPEYPVRTLAVCLFLALACLSATARGSDRTIAQWAHRTWEPKDGAPSMVYTLAQSADGYLWLGSDDGLYRFDGVTFEHFQPQSGGSFPAQDVISLMALPNGDLWIGFKSGEIGFLRKGNATIYTRREGLAGGRVRSFAQDRGGTVWAATSSGLARLEGNRWKEIGKEWNFPGKSARAIFLDHQGVIWVSTEDTVVFLLPGAKKFQLTGIRASDVWQIAQAANGKLWMAETARSVRPIPLADNRQPSDETEVQVGSIGIVFDSEGALWITSVGDGLRRALSPELLKGKITRFSTAVESFTAKDGLSSNFIFSILQDREGNIWVGTDNGLNCFRKTNAVQVVLPFKPQYAVLAAGDAGEVWVEHLTTMVRVRGERADVSPNPGEAIYAFRDSAGAIWWICMDAIHRYSGGSYANVPLPPSFPKPYAAGSAIAATKDGSGTLWIAALGEGLFYRKTGRWQRLESATEFESLPPRTAFTDWSGRAWFGYEEGTIILLKDQNIQRVFRAADSPVGGIRAINGRGQDTWVGGEGGVAFFDGNRFRPLIPADARAFSSVMGVEEEADHSLWLAESRSVIQIPASEVRQALANSSYRVKCRTFDSFDGLPGTFADTARNQKEIQGTDGRLWFAASGGVVWINPATISTNPLPPAVLIRSVTANGRQTGGLANLLLPPRTSNLQIGYTALSLSVPEKVRFRYRLRGVDNEWEDAGTRREALYTSLGPGEYHFQVIACNNDGVWNETGASLDFSIAPAWYQASWFRSLSVAAFVMLLWVLYQLRLRQLQRQFAIGLEARVNERIRIARDLHDTLLQSFNAVLLRLQTVSNVLPARPDEAKRRIDGAIEQASQAITEGRDAVQELRSAGLDTGDLGQAISNFVKELLGSVPEPAPEIGVQIEGTPKPLNAMVRDEVYRVGVEALRNAIRHANAQKVEVEIRYEEQQLRLLIRDDGVGIDPAILNRDHKPGHWGLRGMQERAKFAGGRFEVWSQLDAGTEIGLDIPAASAYADSRASRRSVFSCFWQRRR